jgi:hypothetical protein
MIARPHPRQLARQATADDAAAQNENVGRVHDAGVVL